jgi:hypothetical protein
MKRILCQILIICLFISKPFANPIDEGEQAYINQDYEKPFKLWNKAC